MSVLPLAPATFCTVWPTPGLGSFRMVTVSMPVPLVNAVWNRLMPPTVTAPLDPLAVIAVNAPSTVEAAKAAEKSGNVTAPEPLMVMVFTAESLENTPGEAPSVTAAVLVKVNAVAAPAFSQKPLLEVPEDAAGMVGALGAAIC